MKTSISRHLVALALVFFLLPLSSCTKEPVAPSNTKKQQTEEEVELTAANIEDYIGTNLCFGEIHVSDVPSENTERISCVCYIDIFPTGEYNFESATVVISLQDTSNTINLFGYPMATWSIYYGISPKEIAVALDKDGYGRTSVYLKRINHPKEVPDSVIQSKVDDYLKYREDYKHPLQTGNWSVKFESASGKVTETDKN